MISFPRGKTATSSTSPPVSLKDIIWTWIGSFLGIFAVYFLHESRLAGSDLVWIIGSFGASAVLLFAASDSPLAQPRNMLGGHFLSALVGVSCWLLLAAHPALAGALAVSLAISLMQITRMVHPPGGATALIAVIGSDQVHNLGYLYALVPVLSGAIIMLVIALITHHLSGRKYPLSW